MSASGWWLSDMERPGPSLIGTSAVSEFHMPLIDSQMAAVMLRCSVRQVQRLIKQGALTNKGPRRNVIRIEIDEVQALVDARDRKP